MSEISALMIKTPEGSLPTSEDTVKEIIDDRGSGSSPEAKSVATLTSGFQASRPPEPQEGNVCGLNPAVRGLLLPEQVSAVATCQSFSQASPPGVPWLSCVQPFGPWRNEPSPEPERPPDAVL